MHEKLIFNPQIFLAGVTSLPGVYRMYGSNQELLYVGKAKNLKKRLSSYFNKSKKSVKTESMVAQIEDIEVTVTPSEAEALLLECRLIKDHHPKYNILMRDDKSYPYIILTKHPYPRLDIYRGMRHQQSEFFGPYPSVSAVKQVLNLLQKLFRVRACRDSFFNLRIRPCLQYQIERCTGPCVKKIAQTDYEQNVQQTRLLLEGKSDIVINNLMAKMDLASQAHQYEQAAVYRDMITHIRHIQSLQSSDFYTDEDRIFDSIISQKKKYYQQRESLKEALQLKEIPQRIECFDISHMQGEATVASCVVFNSEGAFKQDYRRFSIKEITLGDDYEAMKQVLYRRYSRLLKEDAALPDLVIIDGGWGQLNVAVAVLDELGLAHLDTIAISKGPDRKSGYEKILIAQSRKTLSFEINHLGFLLLQHIRDEAHRFAVAGHQMARKKKRETSLLEQIPGIGVKRRRDLLRHFGGFQGVFSANLDSLIRVPGLHKELASRIYTYLHGE